MRSDAGPAATEEDREQLFQQAIDHLPPGWSHRRTDHFLFLSNGTEEVLEHFTDFADRTWDQLIAANPGCPVREPRCMVRVFADRESFSGYGGPPGSNAYRSDHNAELVLHVDRRPGQLHSTMRWLIEAEFAALSDAAATEPQESADRR